MATELNDAAVVTTSRATPRPPNKGSTRRSQ
jgi:hypothetical protein